MNYRGVQYEVRTGIVRGEWRVAVFFQIDAPVEKTVSGSRYSAEAAARAIIDRRVRTSMQKPDSPMRV